jgi:phosphoribosylglycinamide formyltransferase-1
MSKLPIVILISGQGTNLQAIIDATKKGLPIEIRAVISNRANAHGLMRAKEAGIATHVIPHQDYSNRNEFEQALQSQIDYYKPKVVALAGFMRKLGSDFVRHYYGRMINVHPSLLPKYPGLETHKRVLEARDKEHGASIHFVTEAVDAGPIICQARLQVAAQDTQESLNQRIHKLEHIIYPQVLQWLSEEILTLKNQEIYLNGRKLPKIGKQLGV